FELILPLFVGGSSPQEGGDGLLLDALEARRNAGLAEVFLRQNVGGDLAPECRDFDVFRLEYGRAVGVADLRRGQPEFNLRVGGLPVFGEAPLDPHFSAPSWVDGPRG